MIVDISHNGQTPTRYYTLSETFLTRLDEFVDEHDLDVVVTVVTEP